MRVHILSIIGLLLVACSGNEPAQTISGLQDEVEIIRDQWGVNHIYANNQHDLFFAQGTPEEDQPRYHRRTSSDSTGGPEATPLEDQ